MGTVHELKVRERQREPQVSWGESRRVGKTTCPAGPTDRQSPFSRASIQRASRHRGAAAWGGQVLASSSYKTDTTDSNMAGGLAATAGGWRDAAQWRGTAQCQLVPLQKEIRPFYWLPHVTYNSPLHTAQQANAFGHAGSSQTKQYKQNEWELEPKSERETTQN